MNELFRDFAIYLICFIASVYALSGVRFEQFSKVKQPVKVQLLMLLLAMAMAYGAGSFLKVFMPS